MRNPQLFQTHYLLGIIFTAESAWCSAVQLFVQVEVLSVLLRSCTFLSFGTAVSNLLLHCESRRWLVGWFSYDESVVAAGV